MNINFDPLGEPRVLTPPFKDFPTRMTERFHRIFFETIGNEEPRAPNYQTLIVLGNFAVVTGLVGTVASYYFQSSEYLHESLGSIAAGAVALGRSYYHSS